MCFDIEYYKPYFNVTTEDVTKRIKEVCKPPMMKNSLSALVENNPDMYGPFWVYVTWMTLLVFCIILAHYIEVKYNYSFLNLYFRKNMTTVLLVGILLAHAPL